METKKNEKIFHWQKSIILSEEHGISSIVFNDKYCFIGSGNGKIFLYDIEMCKASEKFDIGNNNNIIDLKIDCNLLFAACEHGNVIIIELSLGFKIHEINANHIYNKNDSKQQKCVGIYFHSNSNLLVIVYEAMIIVYDYVFGTINEKVDCNQDIASFTFYNGSVFCGCKNSVITRVKLKSFPNDLITGLVKTATTNNKSKALNRFYNAASKASRPSMQKLITKRRALEDIKPKVNWNKGDRAFCVKFNARSLQQ